ncbi:putative deoxyguanosinetriphosphate triphosphohydrolase [Aequitasia blattaphilus]|uniref:Deoxyguanosinetriphosphate triphosphohydrolase n=1 Tax=Aequitasia blattaphilus TaxID=2949332 RepID=A0ABT1E518_9FIRM|nr:deoxyguanosinetriphosphate triphosphohydrolase [Aequitasia blattaphilus]MCP1100936.1 deoxyguanosinetriphosphate triphosphohydrolase [Aequitasia blattaphilus]MCR8613576.1 deoxyguanosinetriphosphate triphosphohydrolase [Aequitasia blattaphilus]
MNWKQLLSDKRSRGAYTTGARRENPDLRSEFEKDYHRIIGSASFRRLQDKTQVFPLDKSDFIRTRLTHSLEVSSFAKSLGQNIGENILFYEKDPDFTPRMKEDISSILQCSGLIHDIGNPPFGHFGETAIREWFQKNLKNISFHGRSVEEALSPQMLEDLYHFEGNAQALRLVTKLHFLVDEHGMNLTYALLNTIVKYPVSSLEIDGKSKDIKYKKLGFYYADEDIYKEIEEATGTKGARHPLTFILEAADDIAYKTADIEDAYIKGMLSYQRLFEALKELEEAHPEEEFKPAAILSRLYNRGVEKQLEKPEEYGVKNWIIRVQGYVIGGATKGFTDHYDEIMSGTYQKDLFYGNYVKDIMDVLGKLAYEEVFTSRKIYGMEAQEAVILEFLLDRFMSAAIKFDDDQPLTSIDKRMIAFISSNYLEAYHTHGKGKSKEEKLYLRLLLVTDYICGMTDSYAKRLYQELNGFM